MTGSEDTYLEELTQDFKEDRGQKILGVAGKLWGA